MLEWVDANKTILFSGLGTGLILFIIGKVYSNKSGSSQKQKSGKGSTNIQVGGNLTISNRSNRDE